MKLFDKNTNAHPLIFLTLSIIVFITYHGVFLTFYQQDEWQTLGYLTTGGWSKVINDLSALQIFFAEGRILARVFYLIFFGIFQFNLTPVFLFAVLCHALNSWLVYHLVKKLKGSTLAGWIAAIFFAVNSVGSQAVAWASAVITVPATTLLLISLFWYIDFLETKDVRKRNLSFIVGILSLFIKETGLFIFFLYPMLYFLWGNGRKIKDGVIANASLLLYGGGLFIFRIAELLFAPAAAAGFVGSQGGGLIFPVIYHSIVYPLTSFFQMFVPPLDIYAFVPRIVRSEYTYFVGSPLFDLAGQGPVADAISLIGTMFVLFVVGFMLLVEKQDTRARKTVSLGILLAVLSFLPYVVLHRDFSYLSPRYYYVGVTGAALLLGYMVTWLYKRMFKVVGIFFIIIVGLYLFHHVRAIQKDLDLQIQYANERKTFLREITRMHPIMNDQTVFYITSDKKYLGEITYPFQNGLGYILEVWYYDSGKIPKSFLASNFLWDLGEEGFRETEGSVFGYFEHLDKLGEEVKKRKILPAIVYGYQYSSATQKMIDITDSVREQLATLSGVLK